MPPFVMQRVGAASMAGVLPSTLCKMRSAIHSINAHTHRMMQQPIGGIRSTSAFRNFVRPTNRGSAQLVSAVSFESVPVEWLAGGASVTAAVIGAVAWSFSQASSQESSASADQGKSAAGSEELRRENAVLVFGASGRTGKLVVQQLLQQGRSVVAAARSMSRTQAALEASGLKVGLQPGGAVLAVEEVDVAGGTGLTQELFRGVSQVVMALGPVFGRTPEGGMGFIEDMTPERVEAQGVTNIVAAAKQFLSKPARIDREVLAMRSADDLAVWERLDDVIMGGKSSSGLEPLPDGSGAVWRGDLIVEGGGFCGARTQTLKLDLAGYDGLTMRVKGDGQKFKVNIKTIDQESVPENVYQATFDTDPNGDWTTVQLPWHNFVPVKRAQSDPQGAPLDPSRISKLGLVLSRFEFNKMPNLNCKPGPFELFISGGLRGYRSPRPALLMVSSAAVERNAVVADDAEARQREIPIVRLNPGGTLNHKYTGEIAVRSSGLPYTVIRPTGMSDSAEEGPFMLETDQGDSMTGIVARAEVAEVAAAALATPEAVGKTFELRRNEAKDAKGRAMGPRDHLRMFLKLAPDAERWRVGLQPFPRAVPPPRPVTPEELKAVVAAVQETQQARGVAPAPPLPPVAAEPKKEPVGARA